MDAVPTFFVPDVHPDQAENGFAELAAVAGVSVPAMRNRIYSMTFEHDGEEWTATVGERLHGIAPPRARSRRERQSIRRGLPRWDSATVLAIFPGSHVPGALGYRGIAGLPYMIVTDATNGSGSKWANPITQGKAISVTHFRAPK